MTQQNPSFRTVRRGYEPDEVDRSLAELRSAADAARAQAAEQAATLADLQAKLAESAQAAQTAQQRVAELEEQLNAAPSRKEVGSRISKILGLAEQEAADLRKKAELAADQLVAAAQASAQELTGSAELQATEVTTRAEASAAQVVEAANRKADEILDYADREATARREEAEAVYEHQRARAASAAADFEKTLAERRDAAAAEFSAQMQAHEQALLRAEERQSGAEAEADRILLSARSQAEAQLGAARQEADRLVESARLTAEKIRRQSERELQAASERRDAITAQLANVRQMLATLGGAALVDRTETPAAAVASGEVEVDEQEQA